MTNKCKPDFYVVWRGVKIRIRRVVTGGYRANKGICQDAPDPRLGTRSVPKLSRYEVTHNGRYLWSDTNWMRARKLARQFADRIADRKDATDGQ